MFVPFFYCGKPCRTFGPGTKIFPKFSFLTNFNFSHILSINRITSIDYFVYNPVYLILSKYNME